MTEFKDKDGIAIKIHDYVKDRDGNRYHINSHWQAVPEEGDAPAVELGRLVESTEVSVMSAADVLNMKPQLERRRRGGRRKDQAELEKAAADAEAKAKAEAEAEEKAARMRQIHGDPNPGNPEGLHPVTEEMILRCLPDDVLAAELRRRGYTLCAFRPALVEL